MATALSLVRAVRGEFQSESAGMFPYRGGARLIKAVFPEFEQPLQDELIAFIKIGRPGDIEFVMAVLRAYGGSMPILRVCKEIIKVVPERSSAWNEVAAAFESTGVVSGEDGIVRAFEAKRTGIAPWKEDENPRVRSFAAWFAEILDQMIVSERQRVEEGLALRKHMYGDDKNEV